MASVDERLKELGLELPPAAAPLAQYVPAKRLGEGVSVAQGRECARLCALNALAAVKQAAGSLESVAEVVQLRGFVRSAPDFGDQPEVVNAASELMAALFGEAGRHVRSAVGVSALPRGVPVELELIVRLKA
ncbi:MAG: RidA family protein [Candidatus Brocadiaceae bacterium]|nr:RidA family protein [Candidatus Brocadiaceae bacterium]